VSLCTPQQKETRDRLGGAPKTRDVPTNRPTNSGPSSQALILGASLSIWGPPPVKKEWLVAIVPTNSPILTLLNI